MAGAAAGGGLAGGSGDTADPARAATEASNPIPNKKSRRMKSSLLIPHASSGVETVTSTRIFGRLFIFEIICRIQMLSCIYATFLRNFLLAVVDILKT